MAPEKRRLDLPPGLLSGIIFFTVVIIGCGYILLSKLHDFPAVYITLVPVMIMIGYALLLGLARLFRLRDDQSGDNLYYMGFLFTLTSLAVSLYQFSDEGSADQIVQNFGIAIASTIAGIALRIFFNQMRRDPIEIEQTSRLELAEASRKVKRELESTVIEFAYFRRATQQSISDALDEVNDLLKEAKNRFVAQLDDFASTSSKPIEDANTRIATALEAVSTQLANESTQLAKSAAELVKSMNDVVTKLKSLQTPDHIIEIKLNPAIQGLSRAVNSFAKGAETQAEAAQENLRQTQSILSEMNQMFTYFRAREREIRGAAPMDSGIASPRDELK